MCNVKLVVSLIVLLVCARGKTTSDAAGRIRAAMQASLDKQRDSVRKQGESGPVKASEFFTIPWSTSAATAVAAPADFACEAMPEPELASLIKDASAREDIKPALLRAVIQKESNGYPCAVSPKGAQGLMQLMPATANDLSVADAFDPKQNVDAGAKFLKQLLTKYAGDLSLALGAYNAGAGRVDKEGGVPQNAETQNYVSEILAKMAQ